MKENGAIVEFSTTIVLTLIKRNCVAILSSSRRLRLYTDDPLFNGKLLKARGMYCVVILKRNSIWVVGARTDGGEYYYLNKLRFLITRDYSAISSSILGSNWTLRTRCSTYFRRSRKRFHFVKFVVKIALIIEIIRLLSLQIANEVFLD